ncbi:hypothetical protein [Novacetimonas hansenii]|nr:hypothetical protein [Novacetimonas hansenii]
MGQPRGRALSMVCFSPQDMAGACPMNRGMDEAARVILAGGWSCERVGAE